MTEIAFNAELLIFQFVVVDDEYGQSLIIIGEKNNQGESVNILLN